jgi:hypothetical protein
MVATIEQILGLDPLGMYDALAAPMSDVFDTTLAPSFAYTGPQSDILAGTSLFAPPDAGAVGSLRRRARDMSAYYAALQRGQGRVYWTKATAGQDFSREDELDAPSFNRALWKGLMGAKPYPMARSGFDFWNRGVPWCPLHT